MFITFLMNRCISVINVCYIFITCAIFNVQTFVRFSGIVYTAYAEEQDDCNQQNHDKDDKNPPNISQVGLFLFS